MDFDRVKNISLTGWALVVAGAAFGGAVLHQSRLVGGLMVGGLAFAYAYSEAPCCAGCAGKTTSGCASSATNTSAGSASPGGIPTMTATGTIVQQGRMSTAPLSSDYTGTAPRATTNPLDLWSSPKFSGGDADPDPSPPAGSSSGCMGCS